MQHINNPFKTSEIELLENKINYQNVIVNNLIRQVNELEKKKEKPDRDFYDCIAAVERRIIELEQKTNQQIEELDDQDTERYDAINELEERVEDLEDGDQDACECCNEPEPPGVKWISFETRIPKELDEILTVGKFTNRIYAGKVKDGEFVAAGCFSDSSKQHLCNFTAWCPVPQKPH